MLQAMRRRIEDDKGFTLIELMVVVLIIAILLAVAIPTFLRVRRNAQDRAAQSSVSAALKAQKAYYTEGHVQYTTSGTELEDIEASIDYFGGISNPSCTGFGDGPKCVEVTVNTVNAPAVNDEVILVAMAANGTFWAIRDRASTPGAGTFYNTGGHDNRAAAVTAATADQW